MAAAASKFKEKAFAKRLDTAMRNFPSAPEGHGRQAWLRSRLEEKFDHVVTAEASRKWFNGESRPKLKVMKLIAAALEVDEAWLSLGITPTQTIAERAVSSATAQGAVNVVAGLIQMAGANVAFAENDEDPFDFHAIIRGKQRSIRVVSFADRDLDTVRLNVPDDGGKSVVIGVLPTEHPLHFTFVAISNDVVVAEGNRRGGYYELEIENSTTDPKVAGASLPVIRSFDKIEGEINGTTDVSPQAKARRALDLD